MWDITTTEAILLSALVAIGLGLFHNWWATRNERTKAAYQTLSSKQWDKDYILARSMFNSAKSNGPNGILDSVKASDQTDTMDQDKLSMPSAVRSILNDYELMFIGVEKGVLDESVINRLRCSTVIDDYHNAKSYIEWMRADLNNQKLYEVFEKYATKWEAEKK